MTAPVLGEIPLPNRARHTMSYRTDGLRYQLHDSEGGKRRIWDSQAGSGSGGLLEERIEDEPSLDFSQSENSQYTPVVF